jgi:hypothetical protein
MEQKFGAPLADKVVAVVGEGCLYGLSRRCSVDEEDDEHLLPNMALTRYVVEVYTPRNSG